jgi:hypothetical protein
MAIQVVRAREQDPSTANQFAQAFGESASKIGSALAGKYRRDEENKLAKEKEQGEIDFLNSLYGENLKGSSSRMREIYLGEKLKGQSKYNPEEDKRNYDFLKENFGQKTADLYQASPMGGKTKIIEHVIDTMQRGGDVEDTLSPHMRQVDEEDLGYTPKEIAKRNLEREKSERKEHHEIAKPVYQELQQIRKNIPLQQQAVEDIMNASPGVGVRDYLADTFKFEPLRTSEGVKLRTAVKDFFLSDLSRAGGRPNMFIEQQLSDALPRIGRDPKANMITAAGMKFKVDLSEKRAEILDRLTEKDLDQYGYVKGKTLDSRANKEMKKYVIDRQYDLKNEIKDIKKGKVSKGTKLDADKALEFLSQFNGDRLKAEKHARELGYEF